MRAANRAHTDSLVIALLCHEDTEWIWIEDLAEEAGLTVSQALATAKHLHLEYGALSMLPSTRAVKMDAGGIDRYEAHQRNFAESRLGERERV